MTSVKTGKLLLRRIIVASPRAIEGRADGDSDEDAEMRLDWGLCLDGRKTALLQDCDTFTQLVRHSLVSVCVLPAKHLQLWA